MKYDIEQLPWHDFATLGLDRMQVLSLPKPTLDALLSGNRTSLIRFESLNIPSFPGSFIDGKLSLKKNKNQELNLVIHPVHPELTNLFSLTQTELKSLREGRMVFIPKLVTDKEGKPQEALVTFDQTTNELVAVRRENLKAPDEINGIKLSPRQQSEFISGKPVSIDNKAYRLDPNNELGISGPRMTSLKIGHSRYRPVDLAADALLLTAGLGHFVMLWHIANVLLHSRLAGFNPEKNLRNLPFRHAIADAQKEIAQQQKEIFRETLGTDKAGIKPLTIDELKNIIEKKAGEHIIINKVEPGINEQAGAEKVSVVQKKDDLTNHIPIEHEKPQTRSFKI